MRKNIKQILKTPTQNIKINDNKFIKLLNKNKVYKPFIA